LKQAHLRIGELTAQKKDLEQKVAALTVELIAARGDKPSRKKKVTTLDYDDALKNLGKKFAVTGELWLDSALFSTPLSITADNSPEARFVDNDTYDQGTIAELHQYIPQKYHEDMANLPEFAQVASILSLMYQRILTYESCQFCNQLNAQRASGLFTVHKMCPTIFNKPQKWFAKTYPRNKEPDLMALLTSKPGKYPLFAPVFYPPGKVSEPKLLFRSEYLALVRVSMQ
jgi:hypothetical protein